MYLENIGESPTADAIHDHVVSLSENVCEVLHVPFCHEKRCLLTGTEKLRMGIEFSEVLWVSLLANFMAQQSQQFV